MPRISDLPPMTTPDSNDELPVVDVSENTTRKMTVGQLMPVGSILDFAGATAPSGWLLCYGQTLNASTNPEYQALYDIIGNTYGGSDYTDFVVPDLRGRVVAGQDDMGGSSADRLTNQTDGIDGDTLGAVGGTEVQAYGLETDGYAKIAVAAISANAVFNRRKSGVTSWTPTHGTTNANGGGYSTAGGVATELGGTSDADNNVQPTIILNKIIRY